jgi:hypothetical protein
VLARYVCYNGRMPQPADDSKRALMELGLIRSRGASVVQRCSHDGQRNQTTSVVSSSTRQPGVCRTGTRCPSEWGSLGVHTHVTAELAANKKVTPESRLYGW